jgi:hypothetical protein
MPFSFFYQLADMKVATQNRCEVTTGHRIVGFFRWMPESCKILTIKVLETCNCSHRFFISFKDVEQVNAHSNQGASILKSTVLRIRSYPIRSFIVLFAAIALCCINSSVYASVSLDRTIKGEGDSSQLNAVSALLAGNEGRLLLDRDKSVLSDYKGKADTKYNMLRSKAFESADARGLARLDENSYLVSNADDDVIAVIYRR